MSTLPAKLKELRRSRNIMQKDLALNAGISRGYYSQIERGIREPSIPVLMAIAEALEVDFNLLHADKIENAELRDFKLRKETNVVLVPIIGEIRAGVSMYAQENIEGYLKVDPSHLSRKSVYFYLKVIGDSMNRIIHEGDLVLVEHTSDVQNGDIVIALISGEEATIKKIRFIDTYIQLFPESYNNAYVPKRYAPGEVSIIGKVKKIERLL